ncbi:MAG TPA: ATP synthase subunit I [Pyrinomonadaceae bacterium]|nr:ATP synthase subunit I [Chloracidobacterium sp.]HBE82148.1 hypothetical protein [Blastocatellia bacterium]HRJ87268.1 ATP synthase subunit I [Pyrinomonadaceae bacterium]HRK50888.1 ATP synthase subunit I [Pyrinomonadaceae bacterium]
MRDENEPLRSPAEGVMPDSHRRILILMGTLGVIGSIAGGSFVSPLFGGGVLIGIGLAFVNYYWLKYSLRRVFENAADGERPKVSAIRYLARYFSLALVIAVIFATDLVPIIAVILGLAGFGFAVVAEGIIRIFCSFLNGKEI